MNKREIKFRAWDSVHEVMINPYCELREGERFYAHDLTNSCAVIADGSVMQYTGLKNLGGVEIYEGDIVKFRSHPNKAYIGTVEYSDEFATFHIAYFPNKVSKDRKYPSFQRLGSCDTIEVIGNIYENPELLEVKK